MSLTSEPITSPAPQRADFGPVSVFFGDKNGKYPDGNQVIVQGRDTRAAFDAPLVAHRLGAEFDEADLVILGHVHEDHMAGLGRVPKTPVHVHTDDLAAARSWEGLADAFGTSESARPAMLASIQQNFFYAPRPDAIPYDDGAVWDLGQVKVRAVHMPGHTAGHCVLLVEPAGVAFIGDIDLSSFGPYYGDASSSLSDFRNSIARLPAVPAKVWITFHHRGVYTDRQRFVDDLQAYSAKLEERDARLIELLRGSPKTLDQLIDCRLIYPVGYEAPWVVDCERRSISQHLAELATKGRVESSPDGAWRIGP